MPRTLCDTCGKRVEKGYNGTCLTCKPLIKECRDCGDVFETKWPQQLYCPVCKRATHFASMDDYKGNVNACSLCNVKWSSSRGRSTEKQGGVDYDRFKCACGAWHYRFC